MRNVEWKKPRAIKMWHWENKEPMKCEIEETKNKITYIVKFHRTMTILFFYYHRVFFSSVYKWYARSNQLGFNVHILIHFGHEYIMLRRITPFLWKNVSSRKYFTRNKRQEMCFAYDSMKKKGTLNDSRCNNGQLFKSVTT